LFQFRRAASDPFGGMLAAAGQISHGLN